MSESLLLYINIVHGRVVAADLGRAGEEERWRVERDRARDHEAALRQDALREAPASRGSR